MRNPEKRTRRLFWMVVLLLGLSYAILSSPVLAQKDADYEQELLPAARVSSLLTMCSYVEENMRGNEERAEDYNDVLLRLLDEVEEQGWSWSDFAGAESIILIQEPIDLQPREDESDEEALLRFFNEEQCEEALDNAGRLIKGDLPAK